MYSTSCGLTRTTLFTLEQWHKFLPNPKQELPQECQIENMYLLRYPRVDPPRGGSFLLERFGHLWSDEYHADITKIGNQKGLAFVC